MMVKDAMRNGLDADEMLGACSPRRIDAGIDKPQASGASRPQGGLSLEDHFDALRFGYAPRAAHRLDKDTSGCLVLAAIAALAHLGLLFKHGKVGRPMAVVEAPRDGSRHHRFAARRLQRRPRLVDETDPR